MKKFIKNILLAIRGLIFDETKNSKKIILLTDNSVSEKKISEIQSRIKYFDPSIEIQQSNKLSILNLLNNKLVAYAGFQPSPLILKSKEGMIFDLDYDTNYEDGWEYHRILTRAQQKKIQSNRSNIIRKLSALKYELNKQYNKVYILGTGPSLEKAYDRSWSDGIRIVSNTIVKDKDLWNHINPHFIVAGDAIYHYGMSDFAQAFRKDISERLAETDTYFVFQEHFLPFIKNNFPQFEDRLIPIPVLNAKTFYNIIELKFQLPGVGNVLNSLLLPLACYFSDNIYLWGFDGRAPNDKLFWKNSDKHFYSDLVPQLQKLHPAFFETLVPKKNPSQYVQSVHGDILNNMLTEAEHYGKKFHLMHFSYTETLMQRFDNQ